jgi:hypothetical protein
VRVEKLRLRRVQADAGEEADLSRTGKSWLQLHGRKRTLRIAQTTQALISHRLGRNCLCARGNGRNASEARQKGRGPLIFLKMNHSLVEELKNQGVGVYALIFQLFFN